MSISQIFDEGLSVFPAAVRLSGCVRVCASACAGACECKDGCGGEGVCLNQGDCSRERERELTVLVYCRKTCEYVLVFGPFSECVFYAVFWSVFSMFSQSFQYVFSVFSTCFLQVFYLFSV